MLIRSDREEPIQLRPFFIHSRAYDIFSYCLSVAIVAVTLAVVHVAESPFLITYVHPIRSHIYVQIKFLNTNVRVDSRPKTTLLCLSAVRWNLTVKPAVEVIS